MAGQNPLLLLAFVIVISFISQNVVALNILAIISLPMKSHYTAFQTLFRELAIRGHSVTVINNYPDVDPPPNLKFVNISITGLTTVMPSMIEFERTKDVLLQELINFQNHFVVGVHRGEADCENLFLNDNMKQFRAKGEKFDVIFVEQFMSDGGLVYAATLYDAPIIGITSHTLLPWAYPRLGIPFDFSSDASYFTGAGTNPSIFKKVQSYLFNLYMTTLGRFRIQQNIYKVFNKYAPNKSFDIEKIAKEKMKMMFVYQHHSVTGARLLAPSLHEIGGIHIQKPKPVPENIEKFIASAKHGVIYVSFGTNLKASSMSSNKLQQFLVAFNKIPQKVLWKMENSTLTAGNDNVLANAWFPQLDILCHPNVLAFVSQGGMLSLSEAAHCGKPLLTIPFFGDQFSNSAAVRESGLGTTMNFHDITADTLSGAIRQLTSPKMQENARRVSKLWHDRPQPVMDSAIYWTEYVARHGTVPAALPFTKKTWFDRSLIDVYSVLLGILLAVVTLIYLIYMVVHEILKFISVQNMSYSNDKKKRA
ncbi:UDP-glycosyltransferase UGT5-like [Maniola hyperantus]|uniref:UDP-glycosyltransferase UGT5-like n=1 Tax=Aphantopus hyperantus TaxID=2795564 RepID=UPI001569BB54|nr:UDP-glucuronosyltransferase 1-2-like [Maniola hyperantus]